METDKIGFKVFIKDVPYSRHRILFESSFLSRVEGRGFHVEGEGTMSRSRVIFFFPLFFFFGKGNNPCNQCH